ncbi:MAG: AcvB/VirJ family lysyl-phosphatidylglycerol hydrolase [Cellvibrio sp.]|uniref:AcvB/VirJ family lysyl-phosphatidylglycerol hydrolase n=1 Tax=Cellvibrio sp. TaxID=1965322 RepID=UPI0031A5EA15
MMRYCLWFIIFLSLHCNAQYQPEVLRWGDFDNTWIYVGGTRAVELVLTDTAHQQQAQKFAAQLSWQGDLAAVLNIDVYLEKITARNASCFDAATPLSVYAQDIQQHHQFKHFSQPFITGFGSAGSYVFAMLGQLPKGIYRGAYSINWQNEINMPVAPCKTSNQAQWIPQQKKLVLDIAHLPSTRWRLFNTALVIQQLMPTFPLLGNWLRDRESFVHELDQQEDNNKNALASLPLIELPTTQTNDNNDLLAIIISGDGGWANIDKDIANQLVQQGIAVVGWNSLDYFWEEKSPEIAGKDLQATIDHYLPLWNKKQVLLIGFSMGADVMPFMANRLNAETKAKVVNVSLLNPSTSVDFVFHVSGWLGNSSEAAHLLYPEMKSWSQWPTLCLYSEQKDSLCEKIQENIAAKPKEQHLVYLPGDHHFDGDYQKLTGLILDNIRKLP